MYGIKRYKTIQYSYNEMQKLWYAQIGHNILFTAKTEGAIKGKITKYINSGGI